MGSPELENDGLTGNAMLLTGWIMGAVDRSKRDPEELYRVTGCYPQRAVFTVASNFNGNEYEVTVRQTKEAE